MIRPPWVSKNAGNNTACKKSLTSIDSHGMEKKARLAMRPPRFKRLFRMRPASSKKGNVDIAGASKGKAGGLSAHSLSVRKMHHVAEMK